MTWACRAACALVALVLPAAARAQEGAVTDSAALEGRPIREVRVQVRNVFDPLPTGPLRFVGRFANRAHVRTRPSVVRDQLLLRPGETWTSGRGHEAARQLRTLSFLEPESVQAIPAGDSVDVEVVTRDVWTTQPEFDVERGGGRLAGSVGFTERNLLGYGKSIALAYRDDPVGITRSIGVSDPGVAGSRLQLRYAGSRGTSGASDGVLATLPFYALDTPWSFGLSALRRSGTAHLFRDNAEVATLGEQVEETQVFAGRGVRRGRAILRGVLSLESLDRRLDPTQVVAGPTVPESFLGPAETLRLRAVALEGWVWAPHFIERKGIARADQVEDFDLGPSLSLKLGVAPRRLGSSGGFGIFRARLEAGVAFGRGFGTLRSTVSGRWRSSAEEVLSVTQGRWIWQRHPEHTLEAAILGIGGFRMPRNYQTVVGGLNGLRAYPVHAVAGARVMRWNLEDRHVLVRELFQIVSIGVAAFVDGARGWGPSAEATEAFHCAGVGVRLGPPRAAIGPVIRMDLAWPVTPTRDGRRDPTLSVGSTRAF